MTVQSEYIFANAVTAATTPTPYMNQKADSMAIEVSGTATTLSVVIEGMASVQTNSYTPLAVINSSDFTPVSNGAVTANGIYIVGIDGIAFIRARVVSVSGGNVTIIGRATRGD